MHHHAAAGPAYDAAIEATGAAAADGTGEEAFERAGHAVHGTTRQVLSLITNPMDVICRNIRTVREKMATRPDILGCHLEGPFLALKCKGAHDSNCLKDPMPELMDRMLDAARWSKLLPAKSTPVPPVFETTSYA